MRIHIRYEYKLRFSSVVINLNPQTKLVRLKLFDACKYPSGAPNTPRWRPN